MGAVDGIAEIDVCAQPFDFGRAKHLVEELGIHYADTAGFHLSAS
jgi:hypothetical protein